MYLFLTPSKTDGRVPSQQGAPATCNLTYRRVQTLLASLGVIIWQNSATGGGEGGGGVDLKEIGCGQRTKTIP